MSLKSERDLNSANRDQVNRARAAAQSKNFDYAIHMMQAVLKSEPLFLEGRRFLRAVEIQKFETLSAFDRKMTSMKVASAAMMISGKKEPAEQLVLAEDVLALDPFQSKANSVVAEAGAALGYPVFKAFAYETLAKGRPNDTGILHQLGQIYMELRDPEKAEKTFNRILEIDPRDGEAKSGLKNASAAHASRTGKWEEEGDYRKQLKNSDEAESLEQGAKVVKSAEAIDAQIQQVYAKHQAEPNNANHSRAIAMLFAQKNDYANAILFYEHAFATGGSMDSAIEKLIGDLKMKRGDQELKELSDAHAQQTDPELQAQYLAAVEQKQAELNQLRLDQAEARVRSYPNDGQYRFELGEALFKAGQYKRATEELQLALKQPSVRYPALSLMGQSFMKRSMFDLAVKRLSDAAGELASMDEMKKEIVYNLGLAYEATKNHEKALEQFKGIYEVDMSYRDVGQRVEASYG